MVEPKIEASSIKFPKPRVLVQFQKERNIHLLETIVLCQLMIRQKNATHPNTCLYTVPPSSNTSGIMAHNIFILKELAWPYFSKNLNFTHSLENNQMFV